MALDEELFSRKEVRLFPTQHIKSIREAELRATASFLAVARAVSEFGRRVVKIAGGSSGKLSCYAEVPFKVQTGAKFREERPDGVMRVTRGKKDWTALVEVKVGDNPLEQDQFNRYHTLARDQGINALITISNESALANGLPPRLTIDKRRLKKVPVVHLSWERLLSEAKLLSKRKAVADPDQQWMLEEWIRYVADTQSRIIEPPQMGKHWHEVLRCARAANLGACKSEMHDVVQHWDAFLRKVALRLRAKLGVDVKLRISKAEQKSPETLVKNLHANAINNGELSGVFRIPNAAGDLSVVVLLAAQSVQYSVEIKAPTEGKATTRINWMIRQLPSEKVPRDLVVQVDWGWGQMSKGRICDLKGQKEQVKSLLWDNDKQNLPDKKSMPRSFSLRQTSDFRKKRGPSTVPVLEGIAEDIEDFYRHVVAGIRPHAPKAPQLPKAEPKEGQASDADSTKERRSESEMCTASRQVVKSEEPRSQDAS